MPGLSDFRLPPPAKWQDFESLCADLWRRIWDDENTQKHGRQGQPQHGVDIFGRPQNGNAWAGVQCKGKNEYLHSVLTARELRDEVEKAKKFEPPLSEFIVACTSARDGSVQRQARSITESHLRDRLFPVSVWSWDDILDRLSEFPDVASIHFPHFQPILRQSPRPGTEKDATPFNRDVAAFTPPLYSQSMLSRARLNGQLQSAIAAGQCVYVCAPSGFGKSVLLSQVSCPDAAWVDCEADLRSFGAFWNHLNRLTTVRYGSPLDPGVGPRELARSVEAIARAAGKGILLIIDHIDGIDGGIRTFMEEVIARTGTLRLILAGSTLRFKRQKALQAGGRLRLISADDLAFTREETHAVVTAPTKDGGHEPSGRLASLVFDVTDGWPIAVQLVRSAFERNRDENTAIEVLERVAEHDLGAYLMESYWDTLDEVFRALLVRTSIYASFDRSDADALMCGMAIANAWDDLDSSPFVRHFPKAPSLLVYQPLFHAFLNKRLRHELTENETAALHHRASLQFLNKGMPPGALHHARRSADQELVTRAAEEQAQFAFQIGDFRLLLDALNSVPVEERWRRGILAVYQGRYYDDKHDLLNALKWYRRAEELFNMHGPEFWQLGIVNDLGGVLRQQGKEDEAIQAYEAALAKLPVDDPSDARARLLANRAHVYLQQGRLQEAAEGLSQARAIFTMCREWPGLANVYQAMAQIAIRRNDDVRAYRLLRSAMRIGRGTLNAPAFLKAAIPLGERLIEKGKYGAAHRLYPDALRAMAATESPAALPFVLNNFGVACSYLSEPDEAGISALEAALTMKRALMRKGAKVSIGGTLQNLTNLQMRTGYFQAALPLAREEAQVARQRGDHELEVDAYAKVAALQRLLQTRKEDATVVPELGERENQGVGTIIDEGRIRAALRVRWPLLREVLASSIESGDETVVNIGPDVSRATTAKTVLFVYQGEVRLPVPKFPTDDVNENLLLELVEETMPIGEKPATAARLAGIWWVRRGQLCWVQAFWVDGREDPSGSGGIVALQGSLFAIDAVTHTSSPVPHPEACGCGRNEVHESVLELAASLVDAYKHAARPQNIIIANRKCVAVFVDNEAALTNQQIPTSERDGASGDLVAE